MKKICYLFLSLVSLVGCNEDVQNAQRDVLNKDQLSEHLKNDPDFSRYIVNKANNIIAFSTLSIEESRQIDFLEHEFLKTKISEPLLKFYESIGYDIDEFSKRLKVKENLSRFTYEQDDFLSIVQSSTTAYISKQLSKGVISMGVYCSGHCTEVADRMFASELDGTDPGTIAHLNVMADRGQYFRGCYHECLRNNEE